MKKRFAKQPSRLVVFTVSIALAQLSGIVGSVFTFSAIPTWYNSLIKPSFTPPNYLFGPVWLLLYTLMGIAAGLLFISSHQKGKHAQQATTALHLYAVQLFLNAIWTPVFFGTKELLLGFLIIASLDLILAILVGFCLRFDRRISLLLLPYLTWVSYATILNASIWLLNP